MTDLDLRGKRVLIRVDFNVPARTASITDDTRIRASLPGIRAALAQGARLMLTSHLGRPNEGEFEREGLARAGRAAPLRPARRRVPLKRDWLDGVAVEPGKVVLLENCRFNKGEKKNDDALAKKNRGAVRHLRQRRLRHRAPRRSHHPRRREVRAGRLRRAADGGGTRGAGEGARATRRGRWSRSSPAPRCRPSSPSSPRSPEKVDQLIVGGGIANTFMLAAGMPIGKSLAEPDLVGGGEARSWRSCEAKGGDVPLPIDVVCAKELSATARREIKPATAVAADDMILDIGPRDRGGVREVLSERRHHRLERPGRRVRVRPVRAGHEGPRAGDRRVAGVLDRRRRRYPRRDRQVRRHRPDLLHLDRRRALSSSSSKGKKLPAIEILEARATA